MNWTDQWLQCLQANAMYWSVTLLLMLADDAAMLAMIFS